MFEMSIGCIILPLLSDLHIVFFRFHQVLKLTFSAICDFHVLIVYSDRLSKISIGIMTSTG